MRHGFIEKHGSEPSVSLHYSDQSSSNSTIQLGIGNELNRSNFNEFNNDQTANTGNSSNSNINSNSNSNSGLNKYNLHDSGPSTSKSTDATTSHSQGAETTSTSCDKNIIHNSVHHSQTNDSSVDDMMDFSSNDELMPEVSSSRGSRNAEKSGSDVELDYSDSDDDHDQDMKTHLSDAVQNSSVFEPHVKQKYIGHRNAR